MNAKLGLAALLALVCLSCSSGDRPHQLRPELRVQKQGKNIAVALANMTGSVQEVSSPVRFAGRGGGDILAVVVDDGGRLAPPCAFIDTMRPAAVESMPQGSERILWQGTVSRLAQWHCLEPGQYSIAFVYRAKSFGLVISNAIDVTIAKDDVGRRVPQ